MNNKIFLIIYCLLTSAVFAEPINTNNCSKVFNVAINHLPPFVFANEANHVAGSEINIIRKVFQKAHCKFTFINFSSTTKRVKEEIKKGNIDIAIGASFTYNRNKYAIFSAPYRIDRVRVFVQEQTHKKYHFKTLADILENKLTVVIADGAWYGKEFELLKSSAKYSKYIIEVKDLSQRLSLIEQGLADAIVGESIAINYELNRKNYNISLYAIDEIISEDTVHLMYSRKSVPTEDVIYLNQFILPTASN